MYTENRMNKRKTGLFTFFLTVLGIFFLLAADVEAKSAEKPKLSSSSLTIEVKKSKKLTVKNKPAKSVGAKYAWSSDNKKVATVKSGKVTGIAAGKANIKVKITAGGKAVCTLKCKVKVTDKKSKHTPVTKKLKPGAWKAAYRRDSSVSMQKKKGMLVIRNKKASIGMYTQTVSVKPYTDYRIRANVRIDHYKKGSENPGGVTVGYGDPSDPVCYETDFVRLNKWTRSQVIFNSGKKKKITLRVANGGYMAVNRGTAYIKDIVFEELPADNKWNVLVLIYPKVNTGSFKASFSGQDVASIKSVLGGLPETIDNLSGGRMKIGVMDTKVVNKTIKSVKGSYGGNLTLGPGNDINFDTYLKGHDYNQIVVFAPLAKSPLNNNWYGLGGTTYRYKGREIYYCIINDSLCYGSPAAEVHGKTYDARLAVLTHELLHCVETNSRKLGWKGFEALHRAEKNGYVYNYDLQWLDWYSDLMRDKIKSGRKGFARKSFRVPHVPD